MQIIEALEIEGSGGKYRATMRHDDPPLAPYALCKCERGHDTKKEALECPEAVESAPAWMRE